ncbi:hypothetical protein [Thiorhodococcus minor]|uniref:Uncharacterized protein n=1 Tax=Thiorhodococcus minor TaxID=57489 RepID=A0A6M0K7G0_9GAMM|nr:hypothetical protein [Thiorhodococcus minor]NEV65321.1 hypothetical protein [Thiorhodococcus minor]
MTKRIDQQTELAVGRFRALISTRYDFVADDLAVVETCDDGADAFAAYRRRHRADPER